LAVYAMYLSYNLFDLLSGFLVDAFADEFEEITIHCVPIQEHWRKIN
jgi:hypothetical protein